MALLLFLALVLGIYFGFSALFGGDEEPPKQPEPAAVRTPPYPRRAPLEDPAPARTPWSQSGPGAADSWSYQGGPSGSGLNTTSRMPGARLDRPGDSPPGSSYGQPYYQYGTNQYGTRQ